MRFFFMKISANNTGNKEKKKAYLTNVLRRVATEADLGKMTAAETTSTQFLTSDTQISIVYTTPCTTVETAAYGRLFFVFFLLAILFL